MSDYERKDNTGSLFSNEENKKTDKHPDYKGASMVNGETMYMSAWVNESKGGKKYMSIKFEKPQPKKGSGVGWDSSSTSSDSSDIPF